MRALVRFIDRQLRRRANVFEYSDDERCLFRARLYDTTEPLPVPGGEIAPGTPVLELHFWNEHMPPLPRHGAGLAWATRGLRQIEASLRDLAERLETDPRFASVQAIGGSNLLFSDLGRGAARAFRRMGFAVSEPPPQGRWRELGEKIHACLLMWTFNQGSLRDRRWRRMRHARFWITRAQFLERHRARPAAGPRADDRAPTGGP